MSALNQVFHHAFTAHGFENRPVSTELLQQIYQAAALGPTAFNASPMRLVWVQSQAAKEQLLPCLMEGNRAQTQQAAVTAIVAYDPKFYEQIDQLFPYYSTRALFEGKDNTEFLLRNSSLSGAYLIIAARAAGLAAGPMSGFDPAQVEAQFLAQHGWKPNFLCNFGYAAGPAPARNPRPDWDQATRTL